MAIPYRIRVGGSLSNSWSDRLAGLRISHQLDANGAHETVLEGLLEDQATLAVVLDTLFELRTPLLSAERTDELQPGGRITTPQE